MQIFIRSFSIIHYSNISTVQESAKCPPVEYVYDMELDLTDGETINETIEVDYEYSYDINVSISVYYSFVLVKRKVKYWVDITKYLLKKLSGWTYLLSFNICVVRTRNSENKAIFG